MRDCPQCGRPVDGLECVHCGFGRSSAKPRVMHDPLRHCCQHEWEGQRCAQPGSLSEGTRGEGPWYCARHFPPFSSRNWGRKPTPPPAGFAPIKDLIRGIKRKEAA